MELDVLGFCYCLFNKSLQFNSLAKQWGSWAREVAASMPEIHPRAREKLLNYLYPTLALEYVSKSLHWDEIHVNSSGQQSDLQWHTKPIARVIAHHGHSPSPAVVVGNKLCLACIMLL